MGRIFCTLLACAVLFAQEPATFKSNTNLVIVNISVLDKSGKLVDNLKREDFVLYEDNKPQNISVFEIERLANAPLTPEPAPALKTREPEKKAASSGPRQDAILGEHAKEYKDRRLIALFFDFSSMQPSEQIRAQDAALKFLDKQMTASDMVAVLTYSNRLRVVEDFTNDRESLITTIRGFRVGESSELAAEGTTGADDTDDSGSFTVDDTEFNIFNTDRKLSALEDAAKKLGRFPEKKALVYIASGVPKTGVENQSQLQSTINAAVRANVAFYPIDARGLIATPPGGDASTPSPKGTGVFTGKTQKGARDKINDQQETLYSLAADTGGKALLDNNDLSVGMVQVQKDINAYYILGYYSTNAAEDGKYRKVRVKLANPELQAKLDYRPGYYASKTFKKFNSSDKERQLEEALVLGDPVTDLPLAVEIDYFRIGRDKYFIPISVKIPGSAIDLSKKDKTDFDFIGQIRDSAGKLVGGVRDGIQIKLDEAKAAQLSHKQLQYDTGLTLPPGDYQLKFLARENQSGRIGTFASSFMIPDLSKQATSVRISSVVLGNQREPLNASVGSANNSKKLIAMHPLIQDGAKLVPSVTRVFRKDQKLYVYFEVYDAGADPTLNNAPSVAAELTMFHGKTKAFESTPIRLNKVAANRANTMAFQFQLPLANLRPGQYMAQVNVIDEMSRKFAFARTPIVLLP
ncbi:MAG: VWA domain-containing protein [Bryobacteraceae bacterium]